MSDDDLEDDDLEDDDYDFLEESAFSAEEIDILNQLKTMKKETNHSIYLLKTNIANICKCEIERKISFILNKKFQLEKIKVEHEKLTSIKHQLSKEFSDCIENSRSLFRSTLKNCHHEYNTLSSDIANFVEKNEVNSEKTFAFVEKQTLKIKENAEKVFVAPSEEGKWVN